MTPSFFDKHACTFLLAIILLSSCAPHAPRPRLDKAAEIEKRIEQYEEYKVQFSSFGGFSQGGEKYSAQSIAKNIQLSETAAEEYRVGLNSNMTGSFLMLGGQLAHFGIRSGANIGILQFSLESVGVGLLIATPFMINANNHFHRAVSEYNRYLKNELELSESDIKKA